MRFAELDAVTVDGYGTLLVLDQPVERLRKALAAHGVERAKDDVAQAFSAEASYYRPRSHSGRDEASLTALRLDCVGVFLQALGNPLTPDHFVDDFIDALVFRPVTGAAETIERLHTLHLSLAVVANWDCTLPGHLDRLGLDRFFSAVVTSAAAGAVKPDPAIFRLALDQLGVAPDRALHVGDEPADEEGARAAGMRFAPAPLARAFAGWS
jgi:putative hydrolase of the HAD superfamily